MAAAGLAMVIGACSSSEPGADSSSSQAASHDAGAEHSHAEGTPSEDGAASTDEHEHDGDEEDGAAFDHHGNPIHPDPFYATTTQNGVEVEFTMQSFLGVGGRGADIAAEIVEGANSTVVFNITDAETREPIAGASPLAWLGFDDGSEESCQARIDGYLSGELPFRPLVDFNSFFVLALNDEPLISVIDPNVSVGGYTQLFTVMLLRGRGEDWAMNLDRTGMVVTIPSMGEVAIADLENFTVLQHVPVGENPVRVAYAPGGETVWVGNDGSGDASGVTILSTTDWQVLAQIRTGDGHHEIAFSPDGRAAYVTNEDDGTLSIVDVERLTKASEVRVGDGPSGLAVHPTSGIVYVANGGSGDVAAVDPANRSVRSRFDTAEGPSSLALSPDGRWGLVANPKGFVYLFDPASSRVAYRIPVPGGPDSITFSDNSAFVRSLRAPEVISIPLPSAEPGAEIEVSVVPIGQTPPEAAGTSLTPNAMFTSPGAGALLVANPADDQVFYFAEGSQGVSGSFQGHGLKPRAVQVVERSLEEGAPGVFTGKLRIPAAGSFQVAFLLTSPRVVHCFTFTAREDQDDDQQVVRPGLQYLDAPTQLAPLEPAVIRFQLTDEASGEPLPAVEDASVLVKSLGGNWSHRDTATYTADGVYEVQIAAPRSGLYQLYVSIESLGADFGELPSLSLRVTDPG